MANRYICEHPDELNEIAEVLLGSFPKQTVFAIAGEMGAGKTTLIQAIVGALGSVDPVSSPTFSLINQYESSKGDIFHFDLYRLKDTQELLDIGFTEYIDSGSFCFIEWPQMALDLLYPPYLIVEIERNPESSTRIISWQLAD